MNFQEKSQSPQTGQFNSYQLREDIEFCSSLSLNPLKRVNSILTLERATEKITEQLVGLNPLKRVNSILTSAILLMLS